MIAFREAWISIQDFFDAGGPVLVWIAVLTFFLWTLIAERFWYARTAHPLELERVCKIWKERAERESWHATQIRESLISEVSGRCNQFVGSIQTLVSLCPLMGLLGTVTGMMEVFEVMALTGSGNARAMAAGVSRATIPTMAGMVSALSGLYFSLYFKNWAARETRRVSGLLLQGE